MMMVKIKAGSSGPRRGGGPPRQALSAAAAAPLRQALAGAAAPPRSGGRSRGHGGCHQTLPLVLVAVIGDRLGLSLGALEGVVERLVAGEDGGELLRDPGAEVLELRDLHVLDPRVGHRLRGGVVGVD